MADQQPVSIEAFEDPHHFARILRTDAELSRHERRDIAKLLKRLAQEVADWRDCAQPFNTAEGGKPNGFRRARLERCRRKYIKESGQ